VSVKLGRDPAGRITMVGGIDPASVAAAAHRPVQIARRMTHHVAGPVIVGPSPVAPSHGHDLVGAMASPAGMAAGRYTVTMVGQGVPATPGSTALLGGSTYVAPIAPMTGASICAATSGLSWVWCRILSFFGGLG
jgi:hypothetical protein